MVRCILVSSVVISLSVAVLVTLQWASPREFGRRLLELSAVSDVYEDDSTGDWDGDPADGFERWMDNAGLGLTDADTGHMMQSLRDKLLLRIFAFSYDVMPARIRDQYKNEFAEVQGIDLEATRVLTDVEKYLITVLDAGEEVHSQGDFNYFHFIPKFRARSVPGQATPPNWESRCWKQVTAETKKVDGGWQLEVTVSGAKHIICADMYYFGTASGLHIGLFPTPIGGTKRYLFKEKGLTESEAWDVDNLGVRILEFPSGPLSTMRSILETALLFVPELTKSPPPYAAQRNLDFLEKYVGITMKKRVDPGGVILDEKEIHSGDFFGIIRLDGLDPMLAWGMGSHTGHTTVAIWEDDQLYVAESTTNSSYWPTNGIQRTPYRQWIKQAREAGFQVVHAPLAAKYRDSFDVKAANAFFHDHEGLEYGFHNLLTGWIDTEELNYPCLPPYDGLERKDKVCLEWEVLEVVVPLVTRFIPAMEKPFVPGWNFHITGSASSGLSATEIYRTAKEWTIPLASIPAIAERDDVLYSAIYNNGTRAKAISMVCDVFVCRMWKAGGVFKDIDNDFSCAEQINNDVYELKVLEAPQTRPAKCVAADPDNALCQLVGDYEIHLPKLGTRDMYPHMQESCPTEPPLYERPDNC